MTDKEILKKAIEKTNGSIKMYLIIDAFWKNPDLWYNLIFSHEFAIAFWGEEDITDEQIKNNGIYFPEGDPHEADICAIDRKSVV